MRFFHCLLSGSLLHATLLAQPTIQHPGAPVGTSTFDVHVATDPGAFTLIPGAAQTWNALGVQLVLAGTATLGPATGPHAATYPEADRLLHTTAPLLGVDDHTFLRTTATALSIVAAHVPADPDVYTDHQDLLRFPLAYQDAFTDTYQYAQPNQVTWTYSGYGTLITSVGIYSNLALLTADDGEFILWHTQPLFPLVVSEGNGFLLLDPASNVGVASHPASDPGLFPNPTAGPMHVVNAHGAGHWRVVDLLGRTALPGGTITTDAFDVPTERLAPGGYVLEMHYAHGPVRKAFVKH